MLKSLLCRFYTLVKSRLKYLFFAVAATAVSMAVALAIGKMYQNWDDDPQRGALAIENSAFNEGYGTPVYLDQGWKESDSLWFYNTTQGSNLLPYDLFIALEQKDSQELFRSPQNFDNYRYLAQKPTFFNPNGLAVGFVKDTYQGKDYLGYTCAACHTGQVNYQGKAIRIDGGPSMADMVGFLTAMQGAMSQTLTDADKQSRFVSAVLALDNDYDNVSEVLSDLEAWTGIVQTYNATNHSRLHYGYARLDAFGRIYNRVLQHVIDKKQARDLMVMATGPSGERMLSESQVDLVLNGINEVVIGNKQFALVLERLRSTEPGYPGLSATQLIRLRNYLFNEPNAPVSYPFLWDIAHADYVQWNGLANNANAGPLGRNAGEVTGVFASLDWQVSDGYSSLGALISGQSNKRKHIQFNSSINLVNLQRLEAHLKSLQSPQWPEDILGKIDRSKAARGELVYQQYCQSCHEIIERDNWDRIAIAQMSSLEDIGTDPAMAENSVNYSGKTGNFKYTYQDTGVGKVIMSDEAPVAMILTAVTKGAVATPDADKWFIRRWLDWLYTLAMSIFDNDIKASVKRGTYQADTTAAPFSSLLAYKARPLNGIWATAPYLHNGSVPSLYDLLLPASCGEDDGPDCEARPETFMVGSREFDPLKVGFRSEGYPGFEFKTDRRGNFNTGHEYAAGKSAQPSGEILPALGPTQKDELLEFLKTL